MLKERMAPKWQVHLGPLEVARWPGSLTGGVAPIEEMASGPRVGPGRLSSLVPPKSSDACPGEGWGAGLS